MNYNNKGYTPLNESKKSHNTVVVFLSSRAEKTTKSSNSMFFFEDAAKKAGLQMITIDPSSSSITKNGEDSYKVIENNGDKKTYELKPSNTIVVPRRTVLKNSESKEFMQDLQSFGFFCFNTLDAIETCEDKFLTYKKLKAADVPTPKTTVITSSSMNKLEEKIDNIGGQFPVVCKILNGTQGVGVFIIDTMMSLKSTLQTMFKISPKSDIILQEKINSDYDLRVHVMYNGFERMTAGGLDGFEIIGCMKRNQLSGDFRSNYSLGSTAEKGSLTPEQEKIAKKAAKATNCRWAGVDLIVDSRTKQSYVIEVNSSPGTKGITTAAGDDVVGTLFNMFKEFKYTKYESEQIGKYETCSIKEFNKDVVVKFDNNKSFTELECSSVNAKDDDVSFVFNGETFNKELSGLRKGEPMVEMNIKFNGTTYKNELVVLKQINGSTEQNILIAGTKFMNRVSNGNTIVDNASFILTDNTTNFEIPKESVNESLNEKQNWLFNVQDEDIKLSGLRKCLDLFANGSRGRYTRGKWSIANGGYDLDWELYYNNVPFMERVSGENPKFQHGYMPEKQAMKIVGVVEAIFDCKVDWEEYYGTE